MFRQLYIADDIHCGQICIIVVAKLPLSVKFFEIQFISEWKIKSSGVALLSEYSFSDMSNLY